MYAKVLALILFALLSVPVGPGAASDTDRTLLTAGPLETTATSAVVPPDCSLDIGSSLAAKRRTPDAVWLSWEGHPRALSYRVFRCDATNGPCTPTFLSNTNEIDYTDWTAFGDHYWFRVEVVEDPCEGPEIFCRTPAGACGGPGTCVEKPMACPHVWMPVCGCDGVTYSNACFSDMAGVSLLYWDQPCY